MKIYYSNINNFNEEIEDFVIAKAKIEAPLIESGEIEKKMSITKFIDYINLSKNIYLLNDKAKSVIPFEIRKPNDEDLVIIFSSTANEEKTNQFKDDLKKIDYDLSKLEHIEQLDLINGNVDLSARNYFMINGEFYK